MPGHKSDYLEFGVKIGLDSKEAQRELQKLQEQLNSLGTLSNPKVGDKLSADMQKASQAAAKLKVALDSAIDIDTGKLDLSKFSRFLKDSGMNLKQYRDQLMLMGPEGEKAFTQVANSVLKAEAPLRRTSKLIDTMWTTLKNTARWELSSSILHGLESSLQKAVTYAQDLNKSLTDIRIVTGYSTGHMAEFAVEANKAAKALSATTTEYTNASLIYFQQGLSDQQVKERTEVTIKMANVTRDSAQVVSDQMTAVWNNFADGSHTLEYYADVMTALGAATASSTKEISDGLEKFAAVAETVGLSYEYAASALATITSNTRQSADVVGTALKTLFARIQGLSLGETLEDGTDLNKYSEALAKVGIQVKEQNGELKTMDDILNEMADVWDKLNNDQQVALAQTVAGVRQYTQLVALMENWDNGDEDSMMANLNTSANATGALQEQADVYVESWEAARDRVTAALESIFNKLLKDEFFIDTLNNIEKIITGIDKFIDSIGGLQGVLTGLGAVATKVFSSQISSGLSNLAYNLNFKDAQERDKQMRIDAANAESSMLMDTHPGQSDAYKKIGKLQVMMIERANQMSDTEKELANHTIERYKNLAKQTEELTKQAQIAKQLADQLDEEVDSGKREVSSEYQGEEYKIRKKYDDEIAEQNKYIQTTSGKEKEAAFWYRDELIKERDRELSIHPEAKEADQKILRERKENLKNAINERDVKKIDAEHAKRENEELKRKLKILKDTDEEYKTIKNKIEENQNIIKDWQDSESSLNNTIDQTEKEYGEVAGQAQAAKDRSTLEKASITEKMDAEGDNILIEAEEEAEDFISNTKGNIEEWSDSLVSTAEGVTALSFGLTQLAAIQDVVSNPDLSSFEKFQAILINLGGGLTSVISGFTSFSKGLAGITSALTAKSSTLAKDTLAVLINKETTEEAAKETMKKAIADGTATGATRLHAGAQAILNGHLAAGLLALWPYILAIGILAAAIWGIVAAYNKWKESTPEAQLEQAKKETEAAAAAAEEAKQAYDDLKSSITSYDSAIEALENLTKGTDEFTEALKRANEEARELILLGKLTPDDYYIDENGAIQIYEKAKEKALNAVQDQYNNALMSEASAKNNEIEKQQTIDAKDTGLLQTAQYRTYYDKFGNERQMRVGYSSKEFNEENLNRAVSMINTTEGGADAWLAAFNQKSENEKLNELAFNIYGESYRNLEEAEKEYIDSLNNATDELVSYSKSVAENELAIQTNTELALATALSADKNYQEAKNHEGYLKQAEKIFNDEKDKAKENLYKDEFGNEITDETQQETIRQQEMEKLGWIQGEEEGTWKYGEDGEEKKLTEERVDEIISDAIARGALENQGENINESINNTYDQLDTTGEQVFEGIKNGNLSNVSNDEFLQGFSSMSGEDFASQYGLTEEDFINLGYDSAETFYAAWNEMQSSYNYEEVITQKIENAYEAIKAEIEAEDLDIGTWEKLVEQLSLLPEYADKSKDELGKLAKAQLKAARGAKEFGENLNDWTKILNGKDIVEKANVLKNEIEPAFKDIFNLSDEDFALLPPDFIEKNWKDLEKGLKGSDKHLRKVAQNMGKSITSEMDKAGKDIVSKTTDIFEEGISQGVEELEDNLEIVNTFHDELASLNDLDIDTQIKVTGSEEFIDKCNKMVQAAGWTAEQTKEYFKSMGYDVEIVEGTKEAETKEEKIQWAPLNVEKTLQAGTPQFDDPKEITLTHTVPEQSAFSIKSITPDGSTGGNVDYVQEKFNSSGGGSSGGGGGSSSSAEPLKYEDEIERYHENTRTLERLSRALEKVSTAKDRAFGKHRLKLIDDEIAATERLVAQQRALLAETKEYLEQDFAEIQQYGFTFDENGELTNYDEVMKQQIDKYNAAVASGNQDAIDAAKKQYDEFKENMQQYEETLTAYEEAQAQLQEYINQVVDLKLEKITTEVEIKILVNDKELTRLEYLLRKIEYEGKGAADAIALMGRQFEQINEKAKPIQEAIDKIYEQARAEGRGLLEEEVKEIKSFYEDGIISTEEEKRIQEIYNKAASEDRMLTQAEEGQIQEYKEQLLELNEEVMDLVETVEGKFMETLEELNGKVDESIGRFATYTGMFQTLTDVITLSGKANSKYGMDMLNTLSAKTVANASAAMRSNLESYKALDKIYQDEQANLERAIQTGDERLIKQYTERLHEVEMMREASYESMLSSWSEALQAANDLFDTRLNNMITKLKQNLGNIDTLVEIYDRAVELEDLYLSGNKSIYELSKLARDIGKDIEGTANIIAKNKLAGLLEQINKLRAEGVKLSQYDLEYWQAKYELELSEIALQEAQEAKAQVKLTRNTAGGWGYVYTADAEAISEAQQQYEDSMYTMQEVHDKYIRDYSDRLIKNRQELVNAFKDLDKTSLTYEEDLLKLKEHYFAQEEYLIAELEKTYERAGVSYQDTILGQTYGDASLQESHANFINSITSMIQDELLPGYEEFQNDVDNINEQAGTTVEQAMDKIVDASIKIEDEVTSRIDDMTTSIKEVADEIWSFQETYGDAIANMLTSNEEYYSKTIKMYKNFMDETEADKWLQYFDDMRSPGEVLGLAGSGATGAMAGNGATAVTNKSWQDLIEALGINSNIGSHNGNSSSKSGDRDGEVWVSPTGRYSTSKGIWEWQAGQSKEDVITDFKEKGYDIKKVDSVADGMNKDREDQGIQLISDEDYKKYSQMATGGYTGSWGSEGKLAILHEKELVLNKFDTKNMLDMVNTLRDIDWRAKLSELWSNIEEKFITPIFGGSEELLQTVQIEANFPGITDRNELEEAFNNLINTASQYANHKKY